MGELIHLKDYRKPSTAKAEDRARSAWELYNRASAIDEDRTKYWEAVELYKRAIELDPYLSIAHTNLGNCYFRLHNAEKAKELYEQAIEVDPAQPEALYNLGCLLLESGQGVESINFFLRALDADPQFSDAHFNLAMAYEQTDQAEKAQPHWRMYIKLEPSGTWTEIARRHINDEQESPKQTTSCSRVRRKGQV